MTGVARSSRRMRLSTVIEGAALSGAVSREMARPVGRCDDAVDHQIPVVAVGRQRPEHLRPDRRSRSDLAERESAGIESMAVYSIPFCYEITTA